MCVSRYEVKPLKCVHSLLSAAHRLQDSDGGGGLSLKALADVVGVSSGPVLKQHLSGLTGSGQILQVLDLIGGPEIN